MKKLLLLLFFLPSLVSASNGFLFEQKVVVNSFVASSTQVNFPMELDLTSPQLRTVTNGGFVLNSSGFDIGIYKDAYCSGKLNWETELYTATTGRWTGWVNVPVMATGTSVWICYGNSSITTDQSNANAVWDSNYKGVWHLPNGTTLGALDSTSNSNTGTITGATATAGQVDGAGNFSGTTQFITHNATNFPINNNDFTVSVWMKATVLNIPQKMVRWGGFGPAVSTGVYLGTNSSAKMELDHFGDDHGYTKVLSTGTWYYITATHTGTTDTMYINAISDGTATTNTLAVASGNGQIGEISNVPEYWHGQLDEVRVSNVVRSQSWTITEYNNQLSTSTFYTISNQQPVFSVRNLWDF